MVRDWDLIRHILLTCEAAPPNAVLQPTAFEWPNAAILAEHVRLLGAEGFIKTVEVLTDVNEFAIFGLEWDGHDLLAQMNSETWWVKIKEVAKEKGMALTFDVIKALALPAAKTLFGLP